MSIKSIEKLNVFSRQGAVIDIQQKQLIQGHAHVDLRQNSVVAPSATVSHTSTDVMQLFIKQGNGKEFDMEFHDSKVAVRRGNDVAVVFAGDADNKQGWGWAVALVNRSTGKWMMLPRQIEKLVDKPSTALGVLLTLVGIPVLTILGWLVAGIVGWGGSKVGGVLGDIAGGIAVIGMFVAPIAATVVLIVWLVRRGNPANMWRGSVVLDGRYVGWAAQKVMLLVLQRVVSKKAA